MEGVKAQFDRGDKKKPIETRDWHTLPPVVTGGNMTIRKVNHPIAFVLIRWFSWRMHKDLVRKSTPV
jgi:hypothetical protein